MRIPALLLSLLVTASVASSASAQAPPRCSELEAPAEGRWAYFFVRGRNQGVLPANAAPPATFFYRSAGTTTGPVTAATVAGPCFAVRVTDGTTTLHATVAYWVYYEPRLGDLAVPAASDRDGVPANPRPVQLRFRPSMVQHLSDGPERAGQLLDRSAIAPVMLAEYDRAAQATLLMATRLGRESGITTALTTRFGSDTDFAAFRREQETLQQLRVRELDAWRWRQQDGTGVVTVRSEGLEQSLRRGPWPMAPGPESLIPEIRVLPRELPPPQPSPP
jgi:hypothetical protein